MRTYYYSSALYVAFRSRRISPPHNDINSLGYLYTTHNIYKRIRCTRQEILFRRPKFTWKGKPEITYPPLTPAALLNPALYIFFLNARGSRFSNISESRARSVHLLLFPQTIYYEYSGEIFIGKLYRRDDETIALNVELRKKKGKTKAKKSFYIMSTYDIEIELRRR